VARPPFDEKHIVLIVSAGRTGTQFFGRFLSIIIDDCYSCHEPDALYLTPNGLLDKLRTFGLWHMLVRRLVGRSGIRNLAQRHLAGRLKMDDLVEELHRHRDRFYRGIRQDLIVESHGRWAWILDAVPQAFVHHKIAAIVRDPRTWVVSWLNRRTQFGPKDIVPLIGRRLDPAMLGDHAWIDRWDSMTPFARNCWTWNATYQMVSSFVERSPRARLYRFEDLFHAEKHLTTMHELIGFIADWDDRCWNWHFDPRLYETRQNASAPMVPGWREWTSEQARELEALCGPLMRKYGYGNEPEWKALLSPR